MLDRLEPQDPEIELRSGPSPWTEDGASHGPLTRDVSCDVVVVGAGITGSLTAAALAGDGRNVVVVDRAAPGQVSTAASTAMLMWEIDRPLIELADLYGFERAADIYRRSLAAVADLVATSAAAGIACDMQPRSSLQLAGESDGLTDLIAEAEARRRAGLPGEFLDSRDLRRRFGMSRPGALLSPAAAQCDPMALTAGMLALATARGARVFDDEVVAFDGSGGAIAVGLAGGRTIVARDVVLATGYVMPDFLPAGRHRQTSTWCFATRPQPEALWPDRVLLWETATPYLYARTTADGRIVCGGEDRVTADAQDRERQTAERLAALVGKFGALWPIADLTPTRVWSAEFSHTEDGLPLIGPVPGRPGMWAAYGYGGNGITFSHMAARILVAALRGETRPWFRDFAIDRTP